MHELHPLATVIAEIHYPIGKGNKHERYKLKHLISTVLNNHLNRGLEPEGAAANKCNCKNVIGASEDCPTCKPVSGEWPDKVMGFTIQEIKKMVDFCRERNFDPRPAQRKRLVDVLIEVPYQVKHPVSIPVDFFKRQSEAALAWMIELVKAQPVCQVPFLYEAKIDRDALLKSLESEA